MKEISLALRLLCVTAHPDDESAGFGGALLLAHARHADTTLICLTEGRAASNRGDTGSDDELAASLERRRHDRCADVESQLRWLRAAGFASADCLYKYWEEAVLVAVKGIST